MHRVQLKMHGPCSVYVGGGNVIGDALRDAGPLPKRPRKHILASLWDVELLGSELLCSNYLWYRLRRRNTIVISIERNDCTCAML